jgi:hypothetical protein
VHADLHAKIVAETLIDLVDPEQKLASRRTSACVWRRAWKRRRVQLSLEKTERLRAEGLTRRAHRSRSSGVAGSGAKAGLSSSLASASCIARVIAPRRLASSMNAFGTSRLTGAAK